MHVCGAKYTKSNGRYSTPQYATLQCKNIHFLQKVNENCHKTENNIKCFNRGNMTQPDQYYECEPIRRTLKEMVEMVNMPRGENYCCVHQPLVMLPLDHIILDELHLMLRISDILIGNIIEDAMQWDEKDAIRNTRNVSTGEHLKRLVDVIRSCGVSFSVWEKKNADGKGSGSWDWTSLMGNDRKKLLQELPPKLNAVIQPDTAQTVIQLWKVTYYQIR